MLRILLLPVLLLTVLMVFSQPAFAQNEASRVPSVCNVPTAGGEPPSFCADPGDQSTTNNTVTRVLRTVVDVMMTVAGIVVIVVIIVSGIQFTTSQGDANQVARARNSILYAVVALVVVLFARTLLIFVLQRISNS